MTLKELDVPLNRPREDTSFIGTMAINRRQEWEQIFDAYPVVKVLHLLVE